MSKNALSLESLSSIVDMVASAEISQGPACLHKDHLPKRNDEQSVVAWIEQVVVSFMSLNNTYSKNSKLIFGKKT